MGDGSPGVLPTGEPQTAQKDAEKAAAPSDSLEAADEEEEADEDLYWDECCRCHAKADVDHSEQGLLCREHEFEEALWEAERAGGPRARRRAAPPRPAKGTPAAEEQAAREAELSRLEKRKRDGRASSGSEGDADAETAGRRKRARQQATDTLRVRYALRHGRAADVIRYLRAAVRGTDAASAAAATALAAMLPERRWPAKPQRLTLCVRCKRSYDPKYPVADACRVPHNFPDTADDDGNVFCKRCNTNCEFVGVDEHGQGPCPSWCFVGSHTTRKSRALHENDGERTSVEQSGEDDDDSEEDEDASEDYADEYAEEDAEEDC